MPKIYSLAGFAEPISSWSHLLAAGVFFVLSILFVLRAKDFPGGRGALLVFGFSSVFLLSMSGVYHLLPRDDSAREVIQRLDHAAIFVLIAGTFTAVHQLLFRGIARWGVIAGVWVVAITALTLKMIYFEDTSELLGLLLYLSLGWLGVFSAISLWRRYDFSFIKPLLYGCVAYTGGALIDYVGFPILLPRVIEAHEVFHLAVLAGLSFHWFFVSQALLLLPTSAPGVTTAGLSLEISKVENLEKFPNLLYLETE